MKKKIIIAFSILAIIVTGILLSVFWPQKEYFMSKDQWIPTNYVAMQYGKHLGISWNNGSYDYYQIKGLDKNLWLYEAHGTIVPMNGFVATVYKGKNVSEEPIFEWDVKEIRICTSEISKGSKTKYEVEATISDKDAIFSILEALRKNESQDILPAQTIDISLLFVFQNHPSLAWKCSIVKSENGDYFILNEDKYYSVNSLKNYLDNYR